MSLVAIVGRPNVGKSTLFNRLVGKRQAIVNEMEGVTRDRHYGKCEWRGIEFSVVDTGGYTSDSEDVFEKAIRKQIKIAIDEADVILFLVEAGTGITNFDDEIADILRQTEKPVLLVVNKVDTSKQIFDSYQFYSLGLGDIQTISSANGSGTGDMLDALVQLLPKEKVRKDAVKKNGKNIEESSEETISKTESEHHEIPRIAIVGKPNVGKSSLANALLDEERNIVTPIAGTTRDAIESHYNKFGHEFILIDTAGLRKKNKVIEDLEFYSVMRAIRTIEDADICILMIDAQSGIEAQDMAIFNLIVRNNKGCLIAVNKWDLVEKKSNTMKQYTTAIKEKIAPFNDIPVIFSSALKKQRILDILDAADAVYANYSKKIPTSRLNEIMLEEIENYPPPIIKGKSVKIKFITQLPTQNPSFAFFCNLPQYIKEPYKRFLENRLRKHFNFNGCPIQIYMRRK